MLKPISFPAALRLLFIGLKLGHIIEWSWIWVVAPIWITFVVGIAIFLFLTFIMAACGK